MMETKSYLFDVNSQATFKRAANATKTSLFRKERHKSDADSRKQQAGKKAHS
jgi:hypothetical protein